MARPTFPFYLLQKYQTRKGSNPGGSWAVRYGTGPPSCFEAKAMSNRDKRGPKKSPGKKSKYKHRGICVYCGTFGPVGNDHVIPDGLFPQPKPPNLITVKACESCNGGFSRDDEYIKHGFGMLLDKSKFPGHAPLIDDTLSMLKNKKNAGLARSYINTFRPVNLVSAGGIYYGSTFEYSFKTHRLLNVCNRIVRGLFFTERKERLAEDVPVWSDVVQPTTNPRFMDENLEIIEALVVQPPVVLGDSVFAYRRLLADPQDDPKASAWLFRFYDKITVLSMSRSIFTANHSHLID